MSLDAGATRKERLIPLPENIHSISVKRAQWNGVAVDVTEARCEGRVLHPLCYENDARLNVLLDEVGRPCEPRLRENQQCPNGYTPRHLYIAPPGVELWGYSACLTYEKDVTLVFDLAALEHRFDLDLTHAFSVPRIRYSDDRIWTLVKLLAEIGAGDDASNQLFGDGLITAIVGRLATSERWDSGARCKLAPWQFSRVKSFMECHSHRRIELLELATLAGLSQSHFSRAFKETTGCAPYQWQLATRIERAKRLLTLPEASLSSVAEATGFSRRNALRPYLPAPHRRHTCGLAQEPPRVDLVAGERTM